MAISKDELKKIIAKHNDPTDPTTIFNIQCSSATNLFSGRFIGDLLVDGDDLVFAEIDNTGEEVYTIRTGLENIDIIKYKSDPALAAKYVDVHNLYQEVSKIPYLMADATLTAVISGLKKTKITDTATVIKKAYDDAVAKIDKAKADRLKLAADLAPITLIEKKFMDSLNLTFEQVRYLFQSVYNLQNEISSPTSTKATADLKTDLSAAIAQVKKYEKALDKYLDSKSKAIDLDKVTKFDQALKNRATLEGIF